MVGRKNSKSKTSHSRVKRERLQGKPLYILEDYAGDPVEGRFYEEQLWEQMTSIKLKK